MKKFKYIYRCFNKSTIMPDLNSLGQNGWQLVAPDILAGDEFKICFIFMREITEQKDQPMNDLNKTLLNIIVTEEKIEAPNTTLRMVKHWEWLVGIGKDHTARIIMDDDAYQEIIKNIKVKE